MKKTGKLPHITNYLFKRAKKETILPHILNLSEVSFQFQNRSTLNQTTKQSLSKKNKINSNEEKKEKSAKREPQQKSSLISLKKTNPKLSKDINFYSINKIEIPKLVKEKKFQSTSTMISNSMIKKSLSKTNINNINNPMLTYDFSRKEKIFKKINSMKKVNEILKINNKKNEKIFDDLRKKIEKFGILKFYDNEVLQKVKLKIMKFGKKIGDNKSLIDYEKIKRKKNLSSENLKMNKRIPDYNERLKKFRKNKFIMLKNQMYFVEDKMKVLQNEIYKFIDDRKKLVNDEIQKNIDE